MTSQIGLQLLFRSWTSLWTSPPPSLHDHSHVSLAAVPGGVVHIEVAGYLQTVLSYARISP
jgi:hypothetical protein